MSLLLFFVPFIFRCIITLFFPSDRFVRICSGVLVESFDTTVSCIDIRKDPKRKRLGSGCKRCFLRCGRWAVCKASESVIHVCRARLKSSAEAFQKRWVSVPDTWRHGREFFVKVSPEALQRRSFQRHSESVTEVPRRTEGRLRRGLLCH